MAAIWTAQEARPRPRMPSLLLTLLSLMKRPPVLRPTLVLATLMRSQTQQAGEATFHYVDFFFFCCFFFSSSAFFPSPFFVVVDVVSFSPVSRQMSFWLVKKMSLSNARQVEHWKSDTPRGGVGEGRGCPSAGCRCCVALLN